MTDPPAGDSTARFSLVAGGPFDAILDRLGLIGPDRVPTWGAAVALALVAWLLPGLLAVAESLIAGSSSALGYFTDGTVYARYLVAIGVMVGTDRYADWRLTRLVRNFHESRLLPQESLPAFNAAVAVADRRSSSALAEFLIFAIALVWSGLTFAYAVDLARSSWEGALVLGVTKLSWAGEAARFAGRRPRGGPAPDRSRRAVGRRDRDAGPRRRDRAVALQQDLLNGPRRRSARGQALAAGSRRRAPPSLRHRAGVVPNQRRKAREKALTSA